MPHRLRTSLPLSVAALALLSLGWAPAADAWLGDGQARTSAHLGTGSKSSKKERRSPGVRMIAAVRSGAAAIAPAAPTPAPPSPSPQASAPPPAPPAPAPAPAPGPRLFAPTSVWNLALSPSAPRDPRSAQLVAALNGQVRRETDDKTGPWINTTKWSVPVYTVGANARRVRVNLDTNKPALQRDFEAVPIPAAARPAVGTDGHMVVYQPSTDTLWEFYRARELLDGWHARWGGKMTNVSSDPGIFPDGFGATGTSLPLLGGLITIDELQAGRIDHALALALPTTAAGTFTWPAQRSDGRTTGPSAVPEGTRFRIDPSLDLDTLDLSPVALTMARAAQRYGIVVRDGAGNVTFYAEDPTPTGTNPYGRLFRNRYPNEVLRAFPWERLEVVAPPSG